MVSASIRVKDFDGTELKDVSEPLQYGLWIIRYACRILGIRCIIGAGNSLEE